VSYATLSRAQPVRIVSEPVKDTIERSQSVEEFKLFAESSPDISPRSSPRTEALEEFLSILKPSFFPPRSPVRNRRQASLPVLHHDHSFSYKGLSARIDNAEELENTRSTQCSRNTCSPGSPAEVKDGVLLDMDDTPFRWFAANVLSSPISRNNTRNPFQRHATYPMTSNSLPLASLSPAAIPLPLPTPDELAYA
jgi:hypothetical protein